MQQKVLVNGSLKSVLADVIDNIVDEAEIDEPVDILCVPYPEGLLGLAARTAV